MPLIPNGFVQLLPGEEIKKGDYLGYRTEGLGSLDLARWEAANGMIGGNVRPTDLVIRPGKPAPPVEKEWLNPWD
jgi:hypothetical protein